MREVEKNIISFIRNNWENQGERINKTFSMRDYAEVTENAIRVFLWGSLIFSIDKKSNTCFFCFHGYATNTTKSRINCLLSAFSTGGISQKNWELLYTSHNRNYIAKVDSTKQYKVIDGKIESI